MTRVSLPTMYGAATRVHRWSGGAHLRLAIVIAWALWFCAPLHVVAQQTAGEPPGYREAIDEALAEYATQNYLEALSLFTRAHKLSPNARTLRGLGSVMFELRRYSESVSFLDQALASEQKPLDAKVRADTLHLLERARGYVGTLNLQVEPQTAQATIDGAPASLEQPVLLDIGEHEVQVAAAGFVSQRRSYTVIGGETSSLQISLQKQSVSSTSSREAVARPLLTWHKALGATAIGAGVASFATAGVFAARRHRVAKRFRAVDPTTAAYPDALKKWGDSRPMPYALATTGALALAGGAAGLFLRAPDRPLVRSGAGISAATGIVLATLGTIELLRGGACKGNEYARQACSGDLERRDRGAITLLSAFPLLVPPVILLFRNWLGQSQTSSIVVRPAWTAARRAFSVGVQGTFL